MMWRSLRSCLFALAIKGSFQAVSRISESSIGDPYSVFNTGDLLPRAGYSSSLLCLEDADCGPQQSCSESYTCHASHQASLGEVCSADGSPSCVPGLTCEIVPVAFSALSGSTSRTCVSNMAGYIQVGTPPVLRRQAASMYPTNIYTYTPTLWRPYAYVPPPPVYSLPFNPIRPYNLTATQYDNADELLVSWSHPQAISQNLNYRVYLSNNEYISYVNTTSNKALVSVSCGETYRIYVEAFPSDPYALALQPVGVRSELITTTIEPKRFIPQHLYLSTNDIRGTRTLYWCEPQHRTCLKGWKVYGSSDETFVNADVLESISLFPSYTLSAGELGDAKYLRVSALFEGGGEGSLSAIIQARTDGPEPTAVRNLKLDVLSENQVKTSWEDPISDGGTKIVSYKIKYSWNEGEVSQYLNISDCRPRTSVQMFEQPSSRVFVEVLALNKDGYHGQSSTASLDIGAALKPTSATNNLNQGSLQQPSKMPSFPPTVRPSLANPGAPFNFTSKLLNTSAVYLSWNPPTRGSGSQIEYEISIIQGTTIKLVNVGSVHEYEATRLTPGATYRFGVSSWTETGKSSPVMLEMALLLAPDPVQNISMEVKGNYPDLSIMINYTPPISSGGAHHLEYRVHVFIDENPLLASNIFVTRENFYEMSSLFTAEDEIFPSPLVLGERYSVYVKTIALSDGSYHTESAPSKLISTLYATRPSPPSAVKVTQVASTIVHVELKRAAFDGGTPITEYVVYWSAAGGGKTKEFVLENQEPLHLNITGGVQGQLYILQAASKTAVGIGERSTPAEHRVQFYPSSPIGVQGTVTSTTSLHLRWESPADQGGTLVSGYEIQYQAVRNNSVWQTVTIRNNTHAIKLTNLNTGDVYHVRVRAKNEVGYGPWSRIEDFRIATAPLQITDLTVTVASASSLHLEWRYAHKNIGSDVQGWNINIYPVSGESFKMFVPIKEKSVSVYSHTVDELEYGLKYLLSVAPVNEVGIGPKTDLIPIQLLSAPDHPQNVKAQMVEDGGAVVNFSAFDERYGIEHYTIYYSTDNFTADPVGESLTVLKPPLLLNGLKPNYIYTFQVTATNKYGSSARSPVTIDSSVRLVTDIKKIEDVKGRAVSATSAVVFWNASLLDTLSTSWYTIYFSTSPSFEWVNGTLKVRPVLHTNYTVETLETKQVYYFRVSAENIGGNGDPGKISPPVLMVVAPSKPTNVTASTTPTRSIMTTWFSGKTGGADIYKFTILVREPISNVNRTFEYRQQAENFNIRKELEISEFPLEFEGVTVEVSVNAVSEVDGLPFVGEAAKTSLRVVFPPGAPRNLHGEILDLSTVQLDWLAPIDFGGLSKDSLTYHVGWSVDGILLFSKGPYSHEQSGTDRMSVQLGIPKDLVGKTVNFSVVCSNGFKQGPTSSFNLNVVSRPLAPLRPTAYMLDRHSVNVSWDFPAESSLFPLIGSIVKYDIGNGETIDYYESNSTNKHSLLPVSTQMVGKVLRFRVQLVNEYGKSEESPPSNGLPIEFAPDPPTGLTVRFQEAGSAQLVWNSPLFQGGLPLTKFVVCISKGFDSPSSFGCPFQNKTLVMAPLNSPGVEYPPTRLNLTLPPDFYVFQVAASSAKGVSAYGERLACQLSYLPIPVSYANTTVLSDTSLLLQWEQPRASSCTPDLTGYAILHVRESKQGTFQGVYEVNVSAHLSQFLFDDLNSSEQHQFSITPLNVYGRGSSFRTHAVTLEVKDGVSGGENINSFKTSVTVASTHGDNEVSGENEILIVLIILSVLFIICVLMVVLWKKKKTRTFEKQATKRSGRLPRPTTDVFDDIEVVPTLQRKRDDNAVEVVTGDMLLQEKHHALGSRLHYTYDNNSDDENSMLVLESNGGGFVYGVTD